MKHRLIGFSAIFVAKMEVMTLEEAHIYLRVEEDQDIDDVYEDKLFELKQFFLNRFPLTKLIEGRLAKFLKVEEAYKLLGGSVLSSSLEMTEDFPDFSSLSELYKWYNIERNKLRLQLTAAKSHNEVKRVLAYYTELTKHYALHWKIPLNEDISAAIKLGTEPNPMDIQTELNALSDKEPINVESILALSDNNCLKSEAKRLSLWLNFETNE